MRSKELDEVLHKSLETGINIISLRSQKRSAFSLSSMAIAALRSKKANGSEW